MEYHPDRNPGANNEACHEMMCKINEAYSVLRNPKLRRLYDEMLREKGTLPDNQTSNNLQNSTDKSHKNSYYEQDRYEYYNSIDLDINSQEEFITWIEEFSKRYINLVYEYYKKLNIDGKEFVYKLNIISKLYNKFELIIEYELNLSKRHSKTNNL